MNSNKPGVPKKCPFCDGSGRAPEVTAANNPAKCPVCKGTGSNLVPADWKRCPLCNGHGTQYYDPGGLEVFVRICAGCKGTGWAEATSSL